MCILYLALIFGLLIFQMSRRGYEHDRQRGRRRGRLHPSFFGRWFSEEATVAAYSLAPLSDKEVHSDDNLIHEVEEYTEGDEVEGDAQPHPVKGDLPHTSHLIYTRSSTGARTFTSGSRPSTGGARVLNSGSHYVWKD